MIKGVSEKILIRVAKFLRIIIKNYAFKIVFK